MPRLRTQIVWGTAILFLYFSALYFWIEDSYVVIDSKEGSYAIFDLDKSTEPGVSFLIIGVQKGGSTSLQWELRQHPQIWMPAEELHYFDKHFKHKSVVEYETLFRDAPQEKAIILGERTPDYMRGQRSMEKIHEYNPNMKLIVTLRDPITRLHSLFKMVQRLGKSNSTLYPCHRKKWIKKGRKGRPPGTFRCILDESNHFGEWVANGLLNEDSSLWENFRTGVYEEQFQVIDKLFPRSQVWISVLEQWTEDDIYSITDFLKIGHYAGMHRKNVTRARNEGMSMETACLLASRYEPYSEKLFKRLGRRIPEWITKEEVCGGR